MAHANRANPLVPTFGVKLNGRPLVADLALWIANVVVEDDLDMPSMFTLELISREGNRSTTPWTDDARLALGTAVEISMGYGDDRESLIVGDIASLEPAFTVHGPPTLVVRGYDRRQRLNGARQTRGFTLRTDSSIAEEICAAVHVSVVTIDSHVTHDYVLQANQTDLEFLRERAHRMRYELAMDGDTLLFRPVNNTAKSVVSLSIARDLLEFRPRMALAPASSFRVLAWDPKRKEPFTSSLQAGREATTMAGSRSATQRSEAVAGASVETIARSPVSSQAEADALASDRFNAASLDFIQGDGRLLGRTDVRAGRVIHLDGLGTRFSGDYYVTSAVHRYTRRHGYVTDFHARRNAS
jgi:phage protein D